MAVKIIEGNTNKMNARLLLGLTRDEIVDKLNEMPVGTELTGIRDRSGRYDFDSIVRKEGGYSTNYGAMSRYGGRGAKVGDYNQYSTEWKVAGSKTNVYDLTNIILGKNKYYDTVNSDYKTESLDDDPEDTNQEYTSADTSINSGKLPIIYKLVSFKKGDMVLDYGGGKFDNGIKYLDSIGCTGVVYDPYNRDANYNADSLRTIRKNNGADIILLSNVLNVIKEEKARLITLKNCKNYLKSGGTLYITVYEGTGKEGPTSKGYQLSKKTKEYIDEIEQVFGAGNVSRKGKLIIAK